MPDWKRFRDFHGYNLFVDDLPYSWVPHLMISVLGILPNGEPIADQSTAMAFWMIILVLVISLAWFAALSFLTARWFEKKEVG